MRLRHLTVSNFGPIDDQGYEIEIDRIVILIGPNNVGKSTVLDAYEAFAATGAPLPLDRFHKRNSGTPVTIAAVFGDVDTDDEQLLGKKWVFDHERFGRSARMKWEWAKPDVKGTKFSWDPSTETWNPGGAGGWDTILSSLVPVPLRVKPTDDGVATEKQVVDMLTSAIQSVVKRDGTVTAGALHALRELTARLGAEVAKEVSDATSRIAERLSSVFPGYDVRVEPEMGKFEPEKLVGMGSRVHARGPGEEYLPLSQHGNGVRRAFLWSAIEAMAELGRYKQGKTNLDPQKPRILLIEEPESFLHPPAIRQAREALYALADIDGWQVMATTHSPIFIDLSKPHSTIVRVSRDGDTRTRLFSTDRARFTDDDLKNLRMIRACHPTVAEFFFADRTILVEGETEQIVLHGLGVGSDSPAASQPMVVNCMGKGNIPMFQRILNQFGTPYTIIHDSDRPRMRRGGKVEGNGMWTINWKIRDEVSARSAELPSCTVICHVPDFETQYFGREQSNGKPDNAIEQLGSTQFTTSEEYAVLKMLVPDANTGHPYRCESECGSCERVRKYAESVDEADKELWSMA